MIHFPQAKLQKCVEYKMLNVTKNVFDNFAEQSSKEKSEGVYTTSLIESINAKIRKATRNKLSFFA